MEEIIKIHARPELKSPVLIASWPGIGNVSVIVATYLKEKLGFKDLAEIDASYFFDPTGVLVRNSVVEAPQFPQSQFYYWQNEKGDNDLVIFLGDAQPGVKIYEMANCVLDVAQIFKIRRIYTFAAALSRMNYMEQPSVWGVATTPELASELVDFGLTRKDNLHIAGLNGLLLGVTKERGLEGLCLLGEVPAYATRIENPKAALAILDSLARILKLDLDLTELSELAKETEGRMRQITAEAMTEYIEHFTRPLWEQGGEEEEEEDEGEEEE